MAITGAAILGFLVTHVAANLSVFAGEAVFNEYPEKLRSVPPLLWGARLGLLAAFVVHIVMAIQLTQRNAAGRPVGYRRQAFKKAGYAARTMKYSGPFIAAFLLFHLAHLTWGWPVVPPAFVEGNPYLNLVNGLSVPWVALVYLGFVALVGLHMLHGAWSLFQTLGVSHPIWNARIKKVTTLVTALIVGGFAIIPLALALKLYGGQ